MSQTRVLIACKGYGGSGRCGLSRGQSGYHSGQSSDLLTGSTLLTAVARMVGEKDDLTPVILAIGFNKGLSCSIWSINSSATCSLAKKECDLHVRDHNQTTWSSKNKKVRLMLTRKW